MRESHGRGGPPGCHAPDPALGAAAGCAGGRHRRPQRKGLGGAAASGGGGVPPGAMGGRLEADLRPAGGGGAGTAGDGNVPPPCRGAAVGKPAHRGGTVPVAAGAATAGSALRAGPAGQPDGVGGGAGGGDRAAVRPVCRARPPRLGPAAGSAADLPAYRLSGDAFAAGAGVLPDHTGGQRPLPAAEPVADGAGGTTAGSAGRSAVVGAGGCGGRHLPDGGVGGGGDAASHGHLLSPVHAAGGRRVSAQSGLLHGPVLPGGGRLRAAEPHHGHGLRLQRLRRHRLPHHCQPQRAAGGHPHQLLRPLQRPLPYADRPDRPVLSGGYRRTGAVGTGSGGVFGGHRVLRGHDAGHVQAAERHGAARTALLFFAGAAALSPASGGAGAGALPAGSDGVCAGTGADGDGPGGAADLGDGEHGRRGRLSAGAGRRGTVLAGTAHGAGRHGAAGLSAGLSRQ